MSARIAPKYGQLRLGSVVDLTDRLALMEAHFRGRTGFSIYYTDQAGKQRYGLQGDDLAMLLLERPEQIASLQATCADANGASISLSLRQKQGGWSGPYILIATSQLDQQELLLRLQGEWQPPDPAWVEKKAQLAALLVMIRQQAIRRDAYELRTRSREAVPLPAAPAGPNLSLDKFPLLYDSFPFEPQLQASTYVQLMERLRVHFFQEEPFYFRVVKPQGDPLGDIGIEKAGEFLDKHRKQVRRLYMEVHSPGHEWMTLQLDFGSKPEEHRAELEISSKRNKQIQATIRDTLEPGSPQMEVGTTMIHEMFRFAQENLRADNLLQILKSIGERFISPDLIHIFLSTKLGETRSGLRIRELRQALAQVGNTLSFLLISANQEAEGHTFSLMFQMAGEGQPAHGSMSLKWGSHVMHQAVRALIWEELSLQPYHLEEGSEGLRRGRLMRVKPTFLSREFRPEPRNGLVVMPLEAYWTDNVWEDIRSTLATAGYSSALAEGLFSSEAREKVWTLLNEVDLLVADLTYKHPGVFYYLGVAHTLGVRTLLITQHERDVPKDLLEEPVLVYDSNLAGMQKLREGLAAWLKK